MKFKGYNKSGQLTIFIVLAIVIVVGILIVVFFNRQPDIDRPGQTNPSEFIKNCVEDVVEISLETILRNGGEIEPTQHIMYNREKQNYLCYQGDYYQPCYNIHPGLEFEIENEIKVDTISDVQECFNKLRIDLEQSGFEVSGQTAKYSIDVLPGFVQINLKKKIIITRKGSSQVYEDFDGTVLSPLYELVKISRDIVNSESKFCNFEYNGYMILYPDYDIKRMDYYGSKLYRVIDRKTNTEFKFAVRSCAYPPGM